MSEWHSRRSRQLVQACHSELIRCFQETHSSIGIGKVQSSLFQQSYCRTHVDVTQYS
jgi:hypothetical protein